MSIYIRKAEIRDIPRIAEIIVFGKRTAYRDIFKNDMVSFNELQVIGLANTYYNNEKLLKNMLVYDDGIVKGLINREYCKSGVEVCDFYIEPCFRGLGIGRRLLEQVIQEAKEQEAGLIYLWVIEENISARQFYERNGFITDGQTKIIEGTDKTDIYYSLRIHD